MGDVDLVPDTTARAREADAPRNSLVARFGADRPLKLDAGVELSPFQIAYKTYGTLNADALQRGAGLPRADRRPACRERQSGDRQVRLVGDHGRPRQADRHRALFRHLPERARRLHGLDRAGLDQSEDRQAVGPGVSGHHHPRHGARAGDAARRARASTRCSRWPAARWAACRCCNGRRAIRKRVFCGAADRLRDAAFGAEHRLPRGRPPGGDGRSGMEARPLFLRRHQRRGAGSRWRAWARTSPIFRTRRCTASSAASSRTARIRPSRSTPTSRWNPICATRASRSSSASTPTPIST